ncbi:hypothetical protein HYH02_006279 [Chlamydomonas schloesseri]|uniref:Uncharacterized protein n=1 Tax=Chlamydomonas schloesseri TaxID=2026947 RepID=A0A835WK71_9CHLO|nr:hypothetical protein HYH02_006279 [Chlamydomonas schloesseri]|eukprot:KAG2448931.1 hypothetical protein HYH02_006279 [Chlamydomonas schloesseri]
MLTCKGWAAASRLQQHSCQGAQAWPHWHRVTGARRAPGSGAPANSRGAVVVRSASVSVELLGRELTEAESRQWQESVAALDSVLGFGADECSRLLARAFGWTTQAFWRREKVQELPSPDQVCEALAFLAADLGMSTEEQVKTVQAFPEVLACDTETRLRVNVGQLQKQWRLQGATLTKAVLRQPQVLGYSVDCSGDCIGECNRCWARF